MPYLISNDPYEEADDLTPQQRAVERRARRRASSAGYRFEKSRQRMLHLNNHGGWMLIHNHTNTCVAGVNFDLPLVKLEAELATQINLELRKTRRSA
jgi:hypothetical protein